MFRFLGTVFNHFFSNNTFQKGASLAYYSVFSLLPMIIILVSILGIVFGKQAVSGEIYTQLKETLGSDAALQIQDIIKNQHVHHNNVLTTTIGFVTLIFSASGMFSQIHNSFNSMWNIKAKPKNSVIRYLNKHLFSFFLLISLFLIILVSASLNSFLIKYEAGLHPDYQFLAFYEHLVSFLVISLVFFIMFRFMSDAKIYWKAALWGGLITGLLFTFGKILIGFYVGKSHLSSTFGSASVLAVIMLWVYYTSQIIFLGTSFIKILSEKLGHPIQPKTDAVLVENVEMK